MKIYSMTATFGKLEHETLTLKPGLNILEAPNEWGKSTWCAFLVAMLYGIDTREKTTKTALAVKERYLPWSGSPMAGRMDIHWNGRDITIERKTKGRVPLGDFKAYETASGLSVPELTAANCGSVLLGIEKSVFLRSAFIRQSDLPVTQDEALRRRLNALVTTGDESGDGDKLAKGLKDLKNKVRYNRSGLLPQAEAQRSQLESTLRELESLESQSEKHTLRQEQIRQRIVQLENHKAALRYAEAQADADKVKAAEAARQEASAQLEAAEKACRTLPPRDRAEQALAQLQKLEQARMDLQIEEKMLPQLPEAPQCPPAFQGMTGEEAVKQAARDAQLHTSLSKKGFLLPVLGIVLILSGIAIAFWKMAPGIIPAVLGIGLLILGLIRSGRRNKQLADLISYYGTANPALWQAEAQKFAAAQQDHAAAQRRHEALWADLTQRKAQLDEKIRAATGNRGLEECRSTFRLIVERWDQYGMAHREAQRAEHYCTALLSMVRTAEPPAQPDDLTYTANETARLLSDANSEFQLLQRLLSQNQGRTEALGKKDAITAQLNEVNTRIRKLEDTYAALTIAQETLVAATAELQRRFAPRISARAKELLSQLTDGRYDRLTLGEDLTIRAGAEQEDTLREALWRSDGTMDQLYLALRLAVAEELAKDAPLILDDAFVRFDDDRLKAALDILQKESAQKQVILFTCQSREKNLI